MEALVKAGTTAVNRGARYIVDRFLPQKEWGKDNYKALDSALYAVAMYYGAGLMHPLVLYSVVLTSISLQNAKSKEELEAEKAKEAKDEKKADEPKTKAERKKKKGSSTEDAGPHEPPTLTVLFEKE